MASRRRSLEEKNLKILRELAAFPSNKQCFDCHQRGPTYINMTIGSFVCTSCSGLLRGLTPPHRVKSITMTMFTPEEIDFLRSRGNEYCKHVWLGTYDSRTSNSENEGKDDQRKKDIMVQKYEKKRWYVDPEIAVKRMQQEEQFQPRAVAQTVVSSHPKQYSKVPEVQPLSQLFGKMPAQITMENNQVADKWPHPVSSASAPNVSSANLQSSMTFPPQGRFDLFAEFGADTLVSSASETTGNFNANGNFANFDSAFSNPHTPERRKMASSHSSNKNHKAYNPPAGWTSFEDDLDPLSPSASSYSVSSASAVSRVQTCTSVMPRPLSLPTFAPTNPFKSFPITNTVGSNSQWVSFAASSGMNSIMSTSASLDAYPSFGQLPKKNAAPAPPGPAHPNVSAEKAAQDRYAALADLDSCYNQPTVTSPSWSVKSVATTTNTATVASVFSFSSSSEVPTSNLFTTAPSNPFATSTSVPWPQPTAKPFAPINPFQSSADVGLPYQSTKMNSNYAPLPVVGNSPSEDPAQAQFVASNNAPFAAFNAGDVSSPTNGYSSGPFSVQNGEFSAGYNVWGMSPSTSMPATFSASQIGQGAHTTANKRLNEFPQYSNWAQNPANPFMAGPNTTPNPAAPKTNSSNPFL